MQAGQGGFTWNPGRVKVQGIAVFHVERLRAACPRCRVILHVQGNVPRETFAGWAESPGRLPCFTWNILV